jgi:hypothetical protein
MGTGYWTAVSVVFSFTNEYRPVYELAATLLPEPPKRAEPTAGEPAGPVAPLAPPGPVGPSGPVAPGPAVTTLQGLWVNVSRQILRAAGNSRGNRWSHRDGFQGSKQRHGGNVNASSGTRRAPSGAAGAPGTIDAPTWSFVARREPTGAVKAGAVSHARRGSLDGPVERHGHNQVRAAPLPLVKAS